MSAEADRETQLLQLAALPVRESETLDPNVERKAASLEDRMAIGEIKSDLASIHSQLVQINSAIVAIQTHSLRQTGGVALTLSVLMVVGWKVLGG